MSSYSITIFLEPRTNVRGSSLANPVLYIEPDGWHGPGNIALQMPSKLSHDDRVKIAETFLKGVTDWRNAIVEEAARERTAADELAAAREEIARLKAERDGGDA
ncbi:hypothetical protein L0F81_12280 [Streptomyces tricolor]|uniref:Uncharacterized protein n=1 Tax=Streptomyces tricolor TaxID=68277 RepID=A0ABS9JEQ4_9ACTN|nr:hypothetical protein [Streptomyces tricolor]MCG0064051.1 hypothetical protein [Streptomyces tricolor]